MAVNEGPSFAGRRLAELRARHRLTAAELAARVPGMLVSSTVITNIESGRKRDMTLTEALALAWALDEPVLAFFTSDSAWGKVPFADLDPTFTDLTSIEYSRLASLTPRAKQRHIDWRGEATFLSNLIGAEVKIAEIQFIENEGPDDDEDATWFVETPEGEIGMVGGGSREGDWERYYQPVIDHYRECLAALRNLERYPLTTRRMLPRKFHIRLERLRRKVVSILANDPDLDYGKDDRENSAGPPAINPSTGRPARISEWPRMLNIEPPPEAPDGETSYTDQ